MPESTRAARLGLLTHRSNRKSELDYLLALDGAATPDGCRVDLTYVPDKLLVEADAFEAYLAAFGDASTAPIEALAFAILDDINNEIVPRWVRLVLSRQGGGPDARSQRIVVEDRQPNWDNPGILASLPAAFSRGVGAGGG